MLNSLLHGPHFAHLWVTCFGLKQVDLKLKEITVLNDKLAHVMLLSF